MHASDEDVCVGATHNLKCMCWCMLAGGMHVKFEHSWRPFMHGTMFDDVVPCTHNSMCALTGQATCIAKASTSGGDTCLHACPSNCNTLEGPSSLHACWQKQLVSLF